MKKQNGITLIALIITIIVMLILVGVTVNVALNGGLFDTAKQAAAGMNIAQIREKAEMAKVVLVADELGDSGIIADIPTYRDRLLEEFGAKETDTNGDNIIDVNDKYVIIIKNSELDIEVFEKTKIPANYLLISLGYETSNIEQDGKIYGINVALNIPRLMSKEEYIALKREQETEEVSDETKKQAFLQGCYEYYSPEEEFTNIDDIALYVINDWWGYGSFETVDEALQDESVQLDIGTTKGEIYWYILAMDFNIELEDTDITEQQAIDAWYQKQKDNNYVNEYNKYANSLKLYVVKDGQEKLIKDKITINVTTANYAIGENGTYEFILKTIQGQEIAREILRVDNIVEGKNSYFITEEEAQGIWTTDGAGTITGYVGESTEIIVPLKIGAENITIIGDEAFISCRDITSVTIPKGISSIGDKAFTYCSSLTNLTISDSVTSIGGNAFAYCTNLTNVTIPKGVSMIYGYAFLNCENLTSVTIPEGVVRINNGAFKGCTNLTSITIPNSVIYMKDEEIFTNCTNLTNIYFAPGSNPIPNEDLKPWGAPKGDAVQVIKLEQ